MRKLHVNYKKAMKKKSDSNGNNRNAGKSLRAIIDLYSRIFPEKPEIQKHEAVGNYLSQESHSQDSQENYNKRPVTPLKMTKKEESEGENENDIDNEDEDF